MDLARSSHVFQEDGRRSRFLAPTILLRFLSLTSPSFKFSCRTPRPQTPFQPPQEGSPPPVPPLRGPEEMGTKTLTRGLMVLSHVLLFLSPPSTVSPLHPSSSASRVTGTSNSPINQLKMGNKICSTSESSFSPDTFLNQMAKKYQSTKHPLWERGKLEETEERARPSQN